MHIPFIFYLKIVVLFVLPTNMFVYFNFDRTGSLIVNMSPYLFV